MYSFSSGYYADDGTKWICCGCKRWVHEECVEEVIVDAEAERFCPYCTSLLRYVNDSHNISLSQFMIIYSFMNSMKFLYTAIDIMELMVKSV